MIFVILLLFPILIIITLLMLASKKSKGKRIRIIVVTLVLPFLIFFADEITGIIYLKNVCEIGGDMEVYNKVKLPEKYLDEKGKPIFINEKGVVDSEIFNSIFKWSFVTEPHIRSFINIDKHQSILSYIKTNQMLGKKVSYSRKLGWLPYNYTLAPTIGESCSSVLINMHGRDNYYKKYNQRKKEFLLVVMGFANTIPISKNDEANTATNLHRYCSKLVKNKKYRKAIDACTIALDKENSNKLGTIYYNRGKAYGMLGEFEEAKKDRNNAIKHGMPKWIIDSEPLPY